MCCRNNYHYPPAHLFHHQHHFHHPFNSPPVFPFPPLLPPSPQQKTEIKKEEKPYTIIIPFQPSYSSPPQISKEVIDVVTKIMTKNKDPIINTVLQQIIK